MVGAEMSGPAGSHHGQSATDPPCRDHKTGEGRSKEKGKGISMASYNIRDGQNGGLNSEACTLGRLMVDIAVLQEVKITDPKYATKKWAGYRIRMAAAETANCGGVALLVKENDDWAFTDENKKVIGPNVISCEMVTGRHKRWCLLPAVTFRRHTNRGPRNGW